MAQFDITLNQEEILQLLLEDRGDAFKKILQLGLNKILQVESSEQLKAEPYERSEERTDSRNGTRERSFTTRIGRIILNVPYAYLEELFIKHEFGEFNRCPPGMALHLSLIELK